MYLIKICNKNRDYLYVGELKSEGHTQYVCKRLSPLLKWNITDDILRINKEYDTYFLFETKQNAIDFFDSYQKFLGKQRMEYRYMLDTLYRNFCS